MKLLGKRVLLKEIEEENIGLVSVDHYEVAHIGDEVTKVKKGDTVFYEQGAKIEIQNKIYIEVKEENIVCVL